MAIRWACALTVLLLAAGSEEQRKKQLGEMKNSDLKKLALALGVSSETIDAAYDVEDMSTARATIAEHILVLEETAQVNAEAVVSGSEATSSEHDKIISETDGTEELDDAESNQAILQTCKAESCIWDKPSEEDENEQSPSVLAEPDDGIDSSPKNEVDEASDDALNDGHADDGVDHVAHAAHEIDPESSDGGDKDFVIPKNYNERVQEGRNEARSEIDETETIQANLLESEDVMDEGLEAAATHEQEDELDEDDSDDVNEDAETQDDDVDEEDETIDDGKDTAELDAESLEMSDDSYGNKALQLLSGLSEPLSPTEQALLAVHESVAPEPLSATEKALLAVVTAKPKT